MVTQRKIYHLLESSGDTDFNFHYLMKSRHPFDFSRPILVTEKVDGQTMQTEGGKLYKRYDLFKNNDPRKHTASEEERYELRALDPSDPAVKWLVAAYNTHREQFEEFGRRYPHLWCYFEGLGSKVTARYKGLAPTVRVFDLSENGIYLPFEQTIAVAAELSLPTVAHRYETFGSLENLVEALKNSTGWDPGFPPNYLFEGWVVRQISPSGNEIVAKIRIKDLAKIRD